MCFFRNIEVKELKSICSSLPIASRGNKISSIKSRKLKAIILLLFCRLKAIFSKKKIIISAEFYMQVDLCSKKSSAIPIKVLKKQCQFLSYRGEGSL